MVASALEDADDMDFTFSDLLALLRTSRRFGYGNPAQECAALFLHHKANRPRVHDASGREVLDCDPATWEKYLDEHDLL